MSSCNNTTSSATCEVCPEETSGIIVSAPVVTTPGKSSINTKPVDTFYDLSKNNKTDDYNTGVGIGIVTEEVITGKGQFDKYMRAGRHQLDTQYELGRIKGADYTAAYIAMQESMMAQANQFILGKYQADALLAKMEAEIGEMKAKGVLERNLLTVQIWKTELDGHLIAEKIETEQLQQQMFATQEEELRKDGESNRTATKQAMQKIKQEIILIATQEIEARRTGASDRSLKNAQADHAAAQKHLVDNQSGELLLNGTSKRALEAAQASVAKAQETLYEQQGKSFEDKNRNDTFKTMVNAYAVSVSELENTAIPGAIQGEVNTMFNSARSKAGL